MIVSKSRYLSKTQLADITGLDRDTVTKKLESLQPYSAKSNLIQYDTRLALPLLYAREANASLDRKKAEESLRYETARADKMEIEVARRREELVETEKVAKVVEQEYTAVRAALLAIPNKLASVLAPLTNPTEVKTELELAVNEVLEELSADVKLEIPGDEHGHDEPTESSTPESPEDTKTET